MPLKINVGLSKKLGTVNYGSVGVTCNVEFEGESGWLQDMETFHRHVRNAYVACTQAVDDELARQQQADSTAPANGHATPSNGGNGRHSGNGKSRSNGRKATASQIRALHAIASRQGLDLTVTLQERYGLDHAEDLSIGQASELIDNLKSVTRGSGGRR